MGEDISITNISFESVKYIIFLNAKHVTCAYTNLFGMEAPVAINVNCRKNSFLSRLSAPIAKTVICDYNALLSSHLNIPEAISINCSHNKLTSFSSEKVKAINYSNNLIKNEI